MIFMNQEKKITSATCDAGGRSGVRAAERSQSPSGSEGVVLKGDDSAAVLLDDAVADELDESDLETMMKLLSSARAAAASRDCSKICHLMLFR